jgi:hypothetical protein
MKQKVFVIIGCIAIVTVWVTLTPASEEYWQNVGPSMDKTLNPNKYKVNKENGTDV